MKVPALLKPTQARSSAQILADMNAVSAEREQAEAEVARRESDRDSLVADSSLDELHAHEQGTGRARLRIEQAEARYGRLSVEHAEALDREQAERTQAELRRGAKAHKEAVKILAEYEAQAAALAQTLSRYRDQRGIIHDINEALPKGVDRIPEPEPFNGRHPIPSAYRTVEEEVVVDPATGLRAITGGSADHTFVRRRRSTQVYEPGFAGVPHRALLPSISLPGLRPDAKPFWGT